MKRKIGVLCTAHWCKFENAMTVALGDEAKKLEYPEKIKSLLAAPELPYALTLKPQSSWTSQVKELISNW